MPDVGVVVTVEDCTPGDVVAWTYDDPSGSSHDMDGTVDVVDEWGVTLRIAYGTGHKHLPSWAFERGMIRRREDQR